MTIFRPPSPDKFIDEVKWTQFQNQLKSELHLAQERAILEQTSMFVIFKAGQAVEFRQREQEESYDYLSPPEGWQVQTNLTFYYTSSGRTNSFQTIVFLNESGRESHLTFQLGSGQFVFKDIHE